jgi:hypothetical protein
VLQRHIPWKLLLHLFYLELPVNSIRNVFRMKLTKLLKSRLHPTEGLEIANIDLKSKVAEKQIIHTSIHND